MTTPIPNPWIIDSAVASPTTGSGAAADVNRKSAAPVDIAETFQEVGPEEAPAAIENPEDCRDFDVNGTDCIHEIFFGYAKQPESEFPPGFDPHAFMDKLEEIVAEIEQPPSFLRQA